MILKLKPEHPLLWRSPDSIQIGLDHQVVVVDGLTPQLEVLLAALQSGVPESGLYMLGEEAGADTATVTAFLERMRPALVAPVPERHHVARSESPVLIDGDGQTADRLRGILGELGITVGAATRTTDDTAGLVVLFGTYVFEPGRHQRWLRRDVPHLPVLFGDDGARIGPLVEPGIGPCLFCVELERTAADPAWPAMAVQLLRHHAPAESTRLSVTVAAKVACLVDDHLAGRSNRLRTRSLGIDLRGNVSRRLHRAQERCGCQTLSDLSTDSQDGDRGLHEVASLSG